MYSKVLSGTLHGVEGRLIAVEADVSEGLPMFNMVGFLASEVREASDRVRTALKNSGYLVSPKRITVNLSPADIRKEGSVFDLPISIALLAAYGYIPADSLEGTLLIGELSLNGDIRGVRGILPVVDFARGQGIRTIILPYGNRKEASVIPDMEIYGAKSLKQVVEHLLGAGRMHPEKPYSAKTSCGEDFSVDFADVKGQGTLKRATEIAVAGMHNILYMGPPGAGKSMIAKRIPTIMPELTDEESIQLTKIYSVNGLLTPEEGLIRKRPFRMPHHSITAQALIGGGKIPRPGEISLAHHGVLFLDEFLEFQKNIIEMMRQPLEDGSVTISRLHGSYTFPCEFMLVAAMNPCPCGYYPDLSRCHCTGPQIERYLKRLSEPMLDRMDMNIMVKKPDYDELYGEGVEEKSAVIRRRIATAQAVQKKRLKPFNLLFNSQIPANLLEEVCMFNGEELKLRKEIFKRYDLSARGAAKVLKVARTIADLDHSQRVKSGHIWEALSYRMTGFYQGGENKC
ncbi:MAG: YifB family Mg chelatase-like AAA ATPase [Bacteroidales bacterium]|nr:YifB family Mg chelatase-like AAA ATPase [Clostridium sp.]MCM1202713.1 YifB family Mg chelatase-like AAA ATPase [Bacteroidales bacterium]